MNIQILKLSRLLQTKSHMQSRLEELSELGKVSDKAGLWLAQHLEQGDADIFWIASYSDDFTSILQNSFWQKFEGQMRKNETRGWLGIHGR